MSSSSRRVVFRASFYGDAACSCSLPYPEPRDGRGSYSKLRSTASPSSPADSPGAREVVGPGGLLVPFDVPQADWLEALSTLWDDVATYGALAEAARLHSLRPEVDPDAICDRFVAVVTPLMRRLRADKRGGVVAVYVTCSGPKWAFSPIKHTRRVADPRM